MKNPTTDRVYPYSPTPPLWRLTVDQPHKLADILLVAFGIDPRKTGVLFGLVETVVTAVPFEQSLLAEKIEPEKMRECPPGVEDVAGYSLLNALAPDYDRLLSEAEQHFRRARTDLIVGRLVLEWLYTQGFTLPNFLRLEVERQQPVIPKRARRRKTSTGAKFTLPEQYADARCYMGTAELARFVHALFSNTAKLPRVDFDCLASVTEEQWRRRFSKTHAPSLDCTQHQDFKQDPHTIHLVAKVGKRGRGKMQTQRHVYWTIVALVLYDDKIKKDIKLRVQRASSLLALLGHHQVRYPNDRTSDSMRLINKVLFRNHWDEWLCGHAYRIKEGFPKALK